MTARAIWAAAAVTALALAGCAQNESHPAQFVVCTTWASCVPVAVHPGTPS